MFESLGPACPAGIAAVAAFAVVFSFVNAARAQSAITVTVDGAAVDFESAPIIQAGRVFVPLRGVFERLGASVVYSNGAIDATGSGRDIALQIGSTQATLQHVRDARRHDEHDDRQQHVRQSKRHDRRSDEAREL